MESQVAAPDSQKVSHSRGLASLHSSKLAWVILFVSLVFTAIAWYLSSRYIHDRAADRFQFRTNEVRVTVEQRMLEYEQVLRGGVGLFNASEGVSREEWEAYFDNAAFQQYYPGIQGIGYSRIFDAAERQTVVDSIRAEGYPDFDIHPEGDRDRQSTIVYLEPFDWRNQRAFGYDMYSEPTRRASMDRAIETGLASISGKVTLLQETDTDVQAGFLVYLPVFDQELPTETPEQRAEAVRGFVYAPFRANDLMSGLNKTNLPDIEFAIFDGTELTDQQLLFDSDRRSGENAGAVQSNAEFSQTERLQLRGRTWTLRFETQPNFISKGESGISFAVACGGLLIDGLLFVIIGSIGRQHKTASAMAEQMTSQFQNAQKQFQAVCDSANDPIILLNREAVCVYGNPAVVDAFGYLWDELDGEPFHRLLNVDVDIRDLMQQESTRECLCVRKNGEIFPAQLSVSQWQDGNDPFSAVVVRDISEQKKSAALIQQQIAELQRSNSDLDAFAYVASHDLRSPLRNIDHLANWVLEDAGDQLPDESKEHLVILKERITRMDQLLDDLLQFSRAGRVNDHMSQVDTHVLVENIVTLLDKPPAMQIHIDRSLPTIQTLKTPLETCLRNLIGNAISHHDRANGNIHVSATIDDQFVHFTVADDGPGIEPNYQKRIFEIFQTLAPKTGKTKSSGIGLSIIKKTVETYHGSVTVESSVGKGAKFTIAWPKEIRVRSPHGQTHIQSC